MLTSAQNHSASLSLVSFSSSREQRRRFIQPRWRRQKLLVLFFRPLLKEGPLSLSLAHFFFALKNKLASRLLKGRRAWRQFLMVARSFMMSASAVTCDEWEMLFFHNVRAHANPTTSSDFSTTRAVPRIIADEPWLIQFCERTPPALCKTLTGNAPQRLTSRRHSTWDILRSKDPMWFKTAMHNYWCSDYWKIMGRIIRQQK